MHTVSSEKSAGADSPIDSMDFAACDDNQVNTGNLPGVDVKYLDDDLIQIASWASNPANVLESATPEFLRSIPDADLDRLVLSARRLIVMVDQEAWRRLLGGDE